MEFFRIALGHFGMICMLPLYFIVALLVHELGHYLAARMLGFPVQSVVFGRGRLIRRGQDRQGTLWSFHIFPLRAHVQIDGFEDRNVPVWKRFLVILAGPLANMILPILLFFAFFASFGKPVEPTIVTIVEKYSPAYEAGLRPGDVIRKIEGDEMASSEDVNAYTHPKREKPLDIVYERHGILHTILVMPEWKSYRDIDDVQREHGMIGLSMRQRGYDLKHVKSVAGMPVGSREEARQSLQKFVGKQVEIGLFYSSGETRPSIIQLSPDADRYWDRPGHKLYNSFTAGTLGDNIYMPLTVIESLNHAAKETSDLLRNIVLMPFNLFPIEIKAYLYSFVFFTSLCSCLLAFLNLIPLPGLDGGALVLLAAEVRAKRPLMNTERATVLVLTLLLFYAAVFGANTNDMRHYYTFKIQKAFAEESN
jgi:membrane-associated protease RseP (regulator of RpoE activity)